MDTHLKDQPFFRMTMLGLTLLAQELVLMPVLYLWLSRLHLIYSFTGLLLGSVLPTILRSTLPFIWLHVLYRKEINRLFCWRKNISFVKLGEYTMVSIGGTHIVYQFAIFITVLLSAFGFQSSTLDLNMTRSASETVINMILLVIVAPLVEEYMFRGVIFGMLRRFGAGFAILASGILFGLYHGNFLQALPNTVTGILFAYAVHKTGSIYTSIAIHAFNNGMAGLGMIFPAFNTAVGWLWFAFMFYAVFWLYRMIRDGRFHLYPGSRNCWLAFWLSPPMLVWYVFYFYEIGLSMFSR